MGGTKRDDARNQARLLISELNDQSYHDSVQVPLATVGKKKLGKAILYKNKVFNPRVTSRSMHEMDLLVYQEAFLTQCPKDLCSGISRVSRSDGNSFQGNIIGQCKTRPPH